MGSMSLGLYLSEYASGSYLKVKRLRQEQILEKDYTSKNNFQKTPSKIQSSIRKFLSKAK